MWGTAWANPPGPNTVWAASSTDDAVFQGGTTGTVTVDSGGISVENITVGASTDTVANNYSFSGGKITLSGATPNLITVTNATDILTINSIISTSTGLDKLGSGTLTLSGNNAGSLLGTVNIGYSGGSNDSTPGGTIQITNGNALGGNTRDSRVRGKHRNRGRYEYDHRRVK